MVCSGAYRFSHRVDGKPVFGVFNMNLTSLGMEDIPAEMFEQYKAWSKEDGFEGLHLLQVLHHNYDPLAAWADAYQVPPAPTAE